MDQHLTRGQPLTQKELSLLTLSELVPDSGYSSVPVAITVDARLRWWPLREAFAAVLRRHPAMRTVFMATGAGYHKAVLPEDACSVDIDVADAGDDLNGALSTYAAAPFAMTGQPLVRLGVFRTGPKDTLCLVAHHLVFDGTSMYVVLDELIELYGEFLEGRAVPRRLEGTAPTKSDKPATAEGLDYWRQHLAGADPTSGRIACGRTEPESPKLAGGFARYAMPEAVVAAAGALRKRHRATDNIVHLAAYSLLLSKSGAGTDLVIGVPIDVRGPDERTVVGFHANMFALRMRVDNTEDFATHVTRVRDTFLSGLRHVDTTVDAVIDVLRPDPTHWRTTPFRYMFNYLPKRIASTGLVVGGVPAKTVAVFNGHSRFDVEFLVLAGTDGTWVEVTYSTEIHHRIDIDMLVERYFALLIDIERANRATIAELSMITAGDRAAMAGRPAQPAAPVPLLLAELARSRPHDVALITATALVSYSGLWTWAMQVADAVRQRGIKPGDVVGVTVDDPVGRVAAVLGTWLSGGVIANAEALRTAGRREVADIGLRALLLGPEHAAAGGPMAIVVPDQPEPADPPVFAADAAPGDPALRTAGGLLTHSALGESSVAFARELAASSVRVPGSAAVDLFTTAVFPHLAMGVPVSFAEASDSSTCRVDLVHVDAAGASTLAAHEDDMSGVTVLCEGAAVPVPTLDRLRAMGARVLRAHRDTATALWVTCGPVADDVEPGWVGLPLPGVRAVITDQTGNALPPGLQGTVHFEVQSATSAGGRALRTPSGELVLLGDRSPEPVPGGGDAASGETDQRILDTLLALWSESLPDVVVDEDTDFFRAGGRSLMAARLVHKAGRLVERRVKLEVLFAAPTPRLLAAALRSG